MYFYDQCTVRDIFKNLSSLLAFTYSLTPSFALLRHQPLISVRWAAGSYSVFIKQALGCFGEAIQTQTFIYIYIFFRCK